MPIYEFACRECGERFERLRSAVEPLPRCPECDGADISRLISMIAGLSHSGSGNGARGSCACGGACACSR